MAKTKSPKPAAENFLVGQTMMKDYRDYVNGEECGERFFHKHIAKDYPDDTGDAAKLGHYLEYLLFKTIPEHLKGVPPEPEYMVSAMNDVAKGKRTRESLKVEDMLAPYREVHRKADIVRAYMKEMKVEVVRVNVEIANAWGRGRLDLTMKGAFFNPLDPEEEVIVDLKYSGLTDNKWDDWGFAFENQNQIDHHSIQGMQYHLIEGKRFFFMLVSSSNKNDTVEFVEMKFSPDRLEKHRTEALYIRDRIITEKEITGFVPRPQLVRCNACTLKESCKFRARIPSIRVVNVQ